MDSIFYYQSPAGLLTAGYSSKGITFLRSAVQHDRPSRSKMPQAEWLDAWFAGSRPDPQAVDLDLAGTDFQLRVWHRLMQIPFGHKTSYGRLGKELRTSPRALGQGIARNPVWIIIPCHRVVYADGSIGGYAGGIAMKKFLLDFEKMHLCQTEK